MLHNEFRRIRSLLGVSLEDDDEFNEELERRKKHATAETIINLARLIIAGIILWNFIGTIFFS